MATIDAYIKKLGCGMAKRSKKSILFLTPFKIILLVI